MYESWIDCESRLNTSHAHHTRHTHTHTYTHAQLTTQLLTHIEFWPTARGECGECAHYAERGQYLGQWFGWQRHALCAGCILHSAQPHTGVFIQGESCLYNLHLTCIKLTIHKRQYIRCFCLLLQAGRYLLLAWLVTFPHWWAIFGIDDVQFCALEDICFTILKRNHTHFVFQIALYRITCKCGGGLPCYCCSMGFLA